MAKQQYCCEYSLRGPEEKEEGWEEFQEEEEEDDGFLCFCPPLSGYRRRPPSLPQYGLHKLEKTALITKLGFWKGSYGLGGPGWVTFDLDNGMSLLCYEWMAQNQIRFSPYVSALYRDLDVHWRIQKINLEDGKFSMTAWDEINEQNIKIESDKDRWAVVRTDSILWMIY